MKNAVSRRNSVRIVALLNGEAGSLEGGDLGKSCFGYCSDACIMCTCLQLHVVLYNNEYRLHVK